MKIDDLISEAEVQQLDELKAGKYAQVASLLGALAAQHGGKAADAATVGWKQQAPHALATLATYADPKKLSALPAALSADELNKGEDEWKRQREKQKIGRLIPSLKEGDSPFRWDGRFIHAGPWKLEPSRDAIAAIPPTGTKDAVNIYDQAKRKHYGRSDEIYLQQMDQHGIPKGLQPYIAAYLQGKATPEQIANHLASKLAGMKKESTMKIDDLVSEEEKRMSRAGKGVMKYGKDGMKALAKAGRNGASDEKLDKLRDKYDKYDEDINEGPRGMGVAARDWAQNKKSQASRRGDAGWSKDYRKPGEPSKAELSAMAAKAKADYDKKKGIKESDDHEASMAKGQLYNACKNAMALYKMIEDGDNLEGWVAAKITKAADYLNAVHDHLAHEEISEEKQRLDPKCWKGYRKAGTKMKGGVRVNNCVKVKK